MKPTWRKKTCKSWKFPREIEPELMEFWQYAEHVRIAHPQIWNLGNSTLGNDIYPQLSNIMIRGIYLEQDIPLIKKWQTMMQFHKTDFTINGVVANLKWLNIVAKGFNYMKTTITNYEPKQKK